MPPKFRDAAALAAAPVEEIARENAAVFARMEYLARAASDEDRQMRADEDREYTALSRIYDSLTAALRDASNVDRTGVVAPGTAHDDDTPGGAGDWCRVSDGLRATVRAGDRFADHPAVRAGTRTSRGRDDAITDAHGDIGGQIRAAVSTSSGAAIVPTRWLGDIIDRARNLSAVLSAGAQIVPMDAKTVQIGRVTGDPTAAFRAEGATITPTDPTIDNVTLDAKTLSALTVVSLEFLQDAQNAGQVVTDVIAQAIALQLDLVALFGGMTTGNEGFSLATPPNPRGILATLLASAPSSVLGGATNGTAQTTGSYWNEVLDTIYTVRDFNESPNSIIWNSKLARQYAKSYATDGQPLLVPGDVTALQRFMSNQINSFTAGTMTSRATDLFAGDFSQLLIGQRLDLSVQVLTERYADSGQVGLVAHWRGDVQLARPRAFAVYRYLQGA